MSRRRWQKVAAATNLAESVARVLASVDADNLAWQPAPRGASLLR
jgi:hypothetical protein